MNKLMDAAIKYATQYGWAVFPVSTRTKKPLTPHGCKDAKKATEPIVAWWRRWPDASIGIATGSMSNLIVIDEDIDEQKDIDGYKSVNEWERTHGELPDTIRAITGRGGNHVYFHYTGNDIGNRAGILEGVDVRGEGGYVIAPPSIHPNGTEYVWEQPPEEYELAELNDTVRQFLSIGKTSGGPAEEFELPSTIQSGERNDTLFRLACSLQSQGLPDEAIKTAIRETNLKKCIEPLDDDELDQLIGSALGYKKGELKVISRGIGEWREPKLTLHVDKNGEVTDRPAQTIANAEEAIAYDPELFGRIRYNELAYSTYVYGNVPWHSHKGWREWTDTDDSNIRSYIENKYKIKAERKIMDALTNVSARLPMNPVQEMLEGCLETWDGNKHVENLLPAMLGCEKSEYNTAARRVFMRGAVTRAY